MADEKRTQKPKERVKYKFGQNDIDLTNYIHNLGTNVQSYLNSKNWNDGQKQEFMNAYNRYLTGLQEQLANNTNRFTTDDFGSIIDSTGALSNTDNDNIDPVGSEYYYDNKGNRITTDDFSALNKIKQKNYNTFSANREVATYFNTIGNALKDMEPPKEKVQDAFDLSKHGFLADWTTTNNPAGGDFNLDPYLEKDDMDKTTGKRGTSNRAAYLKKQIENYINNLGEYDFSSSPFKDRATYISRLRAAADNLGNGYNSEDAIALNQAGIGKDFLDKFFATGAEEAPIQKSELESQAEQAAQKLAEREKEDQLRAVIKAEADDRYNRERDTFFANYAAQNPFQSREPSKPLPLTYNRDNVIKQITQKFKADPNNGEAVKEAIRQYINTPELSKLIRGKARLLSRDKEDITARHIANNLDLAAWADLFFDPKYLNEQRQSILPNGYYVLPGSEDYDNWTYIAYNPKTRQYQEQSMLLNDETKKRMAYAEYDRRHKGVQKQQLGGIVKYVEENQKKAQKEAEKQKRIDEKVKETGKTREQVEAGERVPKKGELSNIDKIRIGSAVADIGSILAAFVPGYGTATSAAMGLGSTGFNLYADISDDSVSGLQAAGNAGFGLLMDTIGLIPGLGATGKTGKIAKTLKYVLPTALTIWGVSENGEDAIKAANKLMNGQDLTVDDWKALSFGLQAIAGGTRAVKGNKSVNKQLKNAKEAIPYRTITAESGKTYKVNPEQFKEITSAATLDAQNKAFREAIGNPSESLGNKFKTSKWEKVRYPFTSEPKTGRGVDYVDRNIDLSTMERIPYQFKVNNGQLVPRRWSNEWILQKTGGWTFGDPSINWFTRKNPLYKKPIILQDSTPITSIPQTKSSIKPGSGPNIRQLRIWNRTPRYARMKGYGKDFGIGDTRNKREIDLGIEFDKHGGILKCQKGNTLTPTSGSGVRKKDTYTFNTTNRLQSVLNKIKEGKITVDDANEFQKRHYSMYSQWNQQPMQGQAVSQYQTDYNNQGWNNEIIAPGFTNNYNIQSTNPSSGDSISGNWTIDGIYDQITDDRRVMARDSDYRDRASRDKDIKLAEQFGFEYYLDPETKYYMLRDKSKKDEGQISQTQQQGSPTKTELAQEKQNLEDSKTNYNPLKTILSNPTIAYGLPRAMYADRMNRRITDLAKKSIVPLLKDPFEVHRYTRSDLDAEMQGERNYADLRRLASRPLTSDGGLQTATQFWAEVQGQEARTAGKEKSNQVQRQYDELAWQQERENAASRHETAMFNRERQWVADQIKNKFEQAYLSQKFNIWDVLGQQLEYDARTKQQEKKALADNFAKSDIHNAISYAPNDYGANLTPNELTVWNKVLSGSNPSSLSPEELTSYKLAAQKVSRAESEQLRQYYSVPNTRWSGKVPSTPWSPTISKAISAKNGAKIAVAGIKAKTADAERFQKQIKECIDRNEKAIDRLSKSLYGLIKASMIK